MNDVGARLRILALDVEAPTGTIREVARADVVHAPSDPWRMERLMSGRYDPAHPRPRPFVGERLSSAVWDPIAPYALVAATADTVLAIPGEILAGLPLIIVLRAWARLRPTAHSKLLDACWRRAIDGNEDLRTRTLEHDVHVTYGMLMMLLDHSSPAELVAFSRKAL